MASRVLGLVRDMVFAALFGGGWMADCFNLAFRVPNLLRDLFAEGALSQAFVTTFSKKLKSEGFGPTRPIDPADDLEAYALNRRVELSLDGVTDPEAIVRDLNELK